MKNTTDFNEYYTTTKIKVISVPNTKSSENVFLEHRKFWELKKKDFEKDCTISIRIYKNTKKLSIEVCDYDEFYVEDISKILKNKENTSKSRLENAKSIYDLLWSEFQKLEKLSIINMGDFRYGDFFTKYN